jgi:3-oxoacyl-[acyl-carrier protein] reductase
MVCVVTGGGEGIGRAICRALALEGGHVAVWDVDRVAAEAVAEELRKSGRRAEALEVDVSRWDEVKAATRQVLAWFGRIDVLVNNAGICQVVSIEQTEEEDWDRVMAVNLKGVFLCSKAVMPSMKERRSGKIINMGSIAGKIGGILTGAHYSASKAAVMCFTKSLARELAPYNVQVNAIAPGVIETNMTRMITKGDWGPYLSMIPLGRIGSVEDVATVAVFLASRESDYITGEIIDVNGGQWMD